MISEDIRLCTQFHEFNLIFNDSWFSMTKATAKLIQLTSIQAIAIRKMSRNNRPQRRNVEKV